MHNTYIVLNVSYMHIDSKYLNCCQSFINSSIFCFILLFGKDRRYSENLAARLQVFDSPVLSKIMLIQISLMVAAYLAMSSQAIISTFYLWFSEANLYKHNF